MVTNANGHTRRRVLIGLVTALVVPAGLAARPAEAQRDNWVRLGTKRVDGRRDSDSIEVDKRGRFRSLIFRVTDSAARIRDVVVHFENGSRFRVPVREVFSRGSRSRTIDLPGNRRDIDRVSFRYSDLRGDRRAEVSLFGLR